MIVCLFVRSVVCVCLVVSTLDWLFLCLVGWFGWLDGCLVVLCVCLSVCLCGGVVVRLFDYLSVFACLCECCVLFVCFFVCVCLFDRLCL